MEVEIVPTAIDLTNGGDDDEFMQYLSSGEDDDDVDVEIAAAGPEFVMVGSDDDEVEIVEPSAPQKEHSEWLEKAHEAMQKAIEANPTGKAPADGKRHDLTVVAKLSLLHDASLENRQAVSKHFGANTVTNKQVENYRKLEETLVDQYKANETSPRRVCDKAKKPSKYKPI